MLSSFLNQRPQLIEEELQEPAAPVPELSPTRRKAIHRWLDSIPGSAYSEDENTHDDQRPSKQRESGSTDKTTDTIYPASSRSLGRGGQASPPPTQTSSQWPELLRLPPGIDPSSAASFSNKMNPVDRIDLVKGSDSDILNQKDRILKDYSRHLVVSALKNGQNPDIVVGQASVALEPDFRRDRITTLRRMLLTLVQEMDDDDRWIVQVTLHTRGICQKWRCFMCQGKKASSTRVTDVPF